MKKSLLFLLLPILCLVFLCAGTLAYFTSENTAHNVITTGGVEIKLLEWADAGKTKPFEDLDGIMPGCAATKIVEVKNTGHSSAWVRVKIEKEIFTEQAADSSMVTVDINTANWVPAEDGYLYYHRALQPGETTEPIFTSVTLSPQMGNEFQNATITVDIAAQAVQTANNGTSPSAANGWPAP